MKRSNVNKVILVFFLSLSMIFFSCNRKEKKDAKNRATAFINQNDVNKDGKVDLGEWKTASEKMFANLEKNMALQAERAKKSNLPERIRARMMGKTPDTKLNLEQFLANRELQFNNFDVNKDGVIEFDEVFNHFFEKLKQAAKRK